MVTDITGKASQSTGDPFALTRWSVVLAARRGDSSQRVVALEQLCGTYWYPLYAYVRRRGHTAEDAQDLTQAYFAQLLARNSLQSVAPEKGRFRAFLLATLKHFLANEWDKAHARKRGGGAAHFSLDGDEAEAKYQHAAPDSLRPDRLFDRQWALTVLELALARLRAEHDTPAKQRQFDELKSALTTDADEVRYAAVAARLETTEGAVRVAVHRLRKRYRELLRAEIAETVTDPAQVTEELQTLFAAFRD